MIHRGNADENIFTSNRDREKFLENLKKAVERHEIKIHTYCLMTNHYHLLVETPQANLSRAINWINVSYAAYFNRKRHRRGHVFQGRFKSILVDADEYLKHLSRYIHLNPLRAKMVEALSAYTWSSYPAFIGKAKVPVWLESDWLLGLFCKGRKKNTARDVAIYLARKLTGVSGVDLGKYFGNISGAGITVRYNHMAGKIAKNRRLKGRVKHIRKQIINN